MSKSLKHAFCGLLLTCCLGVGLTSSAIAQGESFACDASDGRTREFDVPVSPQAYSVSGRMMFVKRDFLGKRLPSLHIAFGDSTLLPDAEHCYCKGIRAKIFPSEPNTVKFYVVSNGHSTGIAQGPVGVPITFSFSIDGDGVMTATFGRTNPQSWSTRLANPRRDRVHLTCSSAMVRLSDVHME